PEKALYPQAQLNWKRAGYRFWLMLPVHFFRSTRLSFRLATEQKRFAKRFREKTIPDFRKEIARAAGQDLSSLPAADLLEAFEYWIRLTLHDFARESLKPTVLAAHWMTGAEKGLAKDFGPAIAKTIVREVSMGARPDAEAEVARTICDLAAGKIDRQAFQERF